MFGTVKIAQCGFGQRVAFQRHNPLIAFHIGTLVHGERHVAFIAEQPNAGLSRAQGFVQLGRVELREAAQTPAGCVVGHERADRAAPVQLQNKPPVKF